jgi:hypothetical protein
MKPYGNRRRKSGVTAYKYGLDWIRLQFAGGRTYTYTANGVGPENLEAMKRLADSGVGLTTFINTHPDIKGGYSR